MLGVSELKKKHYTDIRGLHIYFMNLSFTPKTNTKELKFFRTEKQRKEDGNVRGLRGNFELILNKNESNFQDGMDNLLEELERCERVKQKFESKQLDKISHCEEEAIKMAKELEHVDTREHIGFALF